MPTLLTVILSIVDLILFIFFIYLLKECIKATINWYKSIWRWIDNKRGE